MQIRAWLIARLSLFMRRNLPPLVVFPVTLLIGVAVAWSMRDVQAQVYNPRPTEYEKITVSTTAIGITPATLILSNGGQANYCLVTVEDNAVKHRTDGSGLTLTGNPTSTEGHAYAAGTTYPIDSYEEAYRGKWIRDGGSDAIVTVTCGIK